MQQVTLILTPTLSPRFFCISNAPFTAGNIRTAKDVSHLRMPVFEIQLTINGFARYCCILHAANIDLERLVVSCDV